jgi:hypothetical protein
MQALASLCKGHCACTFAMQPRASTTTYVAGICRRLSVQTLDAAETHIALLQAVIAPEAESATASKEPQAVLGLRAWSRSKECVGKLLGEFRKEAGHVQKQGWIQEIVKSLEAALVALNDIEDHSQGGSPTKDEL